MPESPILKSRVPADLAHVFDELAQSYGLTTSSALRLLVRHVVSHPEVLVELLAMQSRERFTEVHIPEVPAEMTPGQAAHILKTYPRCIYIDLPEPLRDQPVPWEPGE